MILLLLQMKLQIWPLTPGRYNSKTVYKAMNLSLQIPFYGMKAFANSCLSYRCFSSWYYQAGKYVSGAVPDFKLMLGMFLWGKKIVTLFYVIPYLTGIFRLQFVVYQLFVNTLAFTASFK